MCQTEVRIGYGMMNMCVFYWHQFEQYTKVGTCFQPNAFERTPQGPPPPTREAKLQWHYMEYGSSGCNGTTAMRI